MNHNYKNQTPIHGTEHNGDGVYLGRYCGHDLWYHANDVIGPTVVARWSPDGPDYSSGMCFGWSGRSLMLTEARRRAQALGLNVNEENERKNRMPWGGDVVLHRGDEYLYGGLTIHRDGPRVYLRKFSVDEPNGYGSYVLAPLDEVYNLDGQEIPWQSNNLGVMAKS